MSNRTRRRERRQNDGRRPRDRRRNNGVGAENSGVDLPASGESETPLLDAAGGSGVEVVSVPSMDVFRSPRDREPITTLPEGTEVTVTGRRDGWMQIEQGRHSGFARDGQTTAQGAEGGAEAEAEGAGATVLQLANDYNNIAIYAAGQSNSPATTVRTPYVLNEGTTSSVKSSVENLVIAEGRPHAGQRVVSAATSQPWVGKGTPEQIQIIAQAVVDHGLATTGGLQAYMDAGVTRSSGRRNGKFGVDCSGLTGIAMAELEGDDREDGDFGVNAHGYRSNGWSGHTPISPDNAEAGDVISYNTTNHVGVVYSRSTETIRQAGGEGDAIQVTKLGFAESTASQGNEAANGHTDYVRTDRMFWYFREATSVMGRGNPTGPNYTLGAIFGTAAPIYAPDGSGYLIPANGQPSGFAASEYSVMRNPDIDRGEG